MRIEVGIENDDSVCGEQIDTYTACASRKHEDEDIGTVAVEFIHASLTYILLGVAILGRYNSQNVCDSVAQSMNSPAEETCTLPQPGSLRRYSGLSQTTRQDIQMKCKNAPRCLT